MPEYYKPDGNANNIPSKPKNIDEAARASLNNEQRAIERNKEIGAKHDAEIQDRRDAHGRRAEGTKEPGPAERMHSRDSLVNTHGQEKLSNQTSVRTEPTPAQQAMQEKREAARQLDRQSAQGAREPDKSVSELPKQTQSPSR